MIWTSELFTWLDTEQGRNLLQEASRLPQDTLTRLTHLRKRLEPEYANALVETLRLRTKARERFSHADKMLFTQAGLEQATGETVARYHASRLASTGGVLDACSGLGGDTLACLEGSSVVSVEQDSATATCLQINAKNLLPQRLSELSVHCADITTFPLQRVRDSGIDSVLFDPARRITTSTGESRRARNTEDYSPPLSFLETLRATFPNVCLKLSPATHESIFQHYASEAEIELISTGGECREALLWFGEARVQRGMPLFQAGEYSYRATLLAQNGEEVQSLFPEPYDLPHSAEPQAWLYEPDPALIRAHLVSQLASQYGANLITPHIAYITSTESLPIPFTKKYRILATMPYRLSTIRSWLQSQKRVLEAVKKRGVDVEPEKILKELRTKNKDENPTILVLMPYQERTIAILCEHP